MENTDKAMVDNFWFLEERLKGLKEGEFYPIVILKRKKDNPTEKKQAKVLYRMNMYSEGDLKKYKASIIQTCKDHNARCYVKINKRNDEDVSGAMVKYVLERHLGKEFKSVREAYDHCVGVTESADVRYYLIDVDVEAIETDMHLESALAEIDKCFANFKLMKRMKEHPIYKLPTKNGAHILAPGFDTKTFEATIQANNFPGITMSIRKDADTLIYMQ